MRLVMKIRILTLVFISYALIGCIESLRTYSQEAQLYCNLHKIESWKDFPRDASLDDFIKEYDKRVSAVGFSSEFKEVIRDIDKIIFLKNLYPGAKAKISALTGEPWDCPAYQEFHHVEYEKVDPEETMGIGKPLRIEISSSGAVVINDGLLVNITAEEINKVISSLGLKSPVSASVTVYYDAPEEILNQVMHALKETEVEDLVIIEK